MLKNFSNSQKRITKYFLFIFLAELLSLCGFLLPEFRQFAFLIVVFLFFILAMFDLKIALLVLLTEILIGSKGYLLFFESSGLIVSVRMAFWLIVMAVWFSKAIVDLRNFKQSVYFNFFRSEFFKYYLVLFLFLIWGLINGFINRNGFHNIFFDFNGWLFFTLLLPFYSCFSKKEDLKKIYEISVAALSWLCLKSLFLFYVLSHSIPVINHYLYRWVRVSGVGEMTDLQNGFFRIFFQSHIFLLPAFLIVLVFILYKIKKDESKKNLLTLFTWSTFLLLIIFLGGSRSNWLGLIFSLLIFVFIIFYHFNLKIFLKMILIFSLSVFVSLSLLVAVAKFPWPKAGGDFVVSELMKERAGQVSGEAGVSSRWALLEVLQKEIKSSLILGGGFGATVTYISSDPRVLESSPKGEYTTYAFEWGWLDIFYKLGLFGCLAYLVLIIKISLATVIDFFVLRKKYFTFENTLKIGFVLGLITISVVSIFSPYLNHPLGISYFIIYSLVLDKKLNILEK